MKIITRVNALNNLKKYTGKRLRHFAVEYGITTFETGKQNKGWKGLILERLAGLETNISKAPNGLSWELKSVSFYEVKGELVPKETMAITMINPRELIETEFFDSHCWEKLKAMIFCAVMWNGKNSDDGQLLKVSSLDFSETDDLILEIKEDYDFIKNKLVNKGFNALTGKDGKWIQARTKGTGGVNPKTGKRRPITRAFYARKKFVKKIFEIGE
jgi:DNA mismatch repair protein MutH